METLLILKLLATLAADAGTHSGRAAYVASAGAGQPPSTLVAARQAYTGWEASRAGDAAWRASKTASVPVETSVLFPSGAESFAIVDSLTEEWAYLVYSPSDEIRTIRADLLPDCARVEGAAIRRVDGAVSLPWVKGQQAESGRWFQCDEPTHADCTRALGGAPYSDPR